MNILVLLKHTPDTGANFKVQNNQLDKSGVKYMMNPYDELALEEALRLKDQDSSHQVIAVSLGPQEAKETLLRALAMGADRGILLSTQENLDSLQVAENLAECLRQEKADLVLGGKQGIDDDNMHVLPMIGAILDWPHVNGVSQAVWEKDKVTVKRDVEAGMVESYTMSFPGILGANRGLNEPRYASAMGLMKAKKKPLEEKMLQNLKPASTEILSYEMPPAKPQGKILTGQPAETMVVEMIRLLKQEAKIL